MSAEILVGLHPLFDCLTDGVCVADGEGKLLYANDAARRLLGASAEQAVKTAICGVLCEGFEGRCEDARSCPLRVPRGPDDAMTFKGRFVLTGRELRVRCFRVRLSRSERHFLIIEDVTAQAEAGRRMELWRQMFAHDLRTPLTVASGTLRAVEDMGVGHRLDAVDIELIQGGARNCRRLESLIRAYLDATRLEEGKMPVHAGIVDLAPLARTVADELAPAALERRQELALDVPAGLAARADPELLRRALANIVGNALKFTPAGGRIEVSAAARGESVLIRTADSGPGIAAQDLPHIFDRYYQGADSQRRQGLGLGLTFCRLALRAMDGEVEVDSPSGAGAVFTLRIPLASHEGGSS